ncbi:YtxH domain-containing protein [Paraclostridium bifermentans]|nr:YtxH domain-containing protein [Paraclostridium bifermentans]
MSKNKGKVFLLGSIIGFLLGIFLAPKKVLS